MREKHATNEQREQLAEHLMTALVLSLAHDLAIEGRRKGVTGRDYVGDAVALIRQSRARIVELLGCRRRRRARETEGETPVRVSAAPGR